MSRLSKTAIIAFLMLFAIAGTVAAQTWSQEQQEIWKFEEQQWQMDQDKDMSWIDTMVHPNVSFWGTGEPLPRNKASLARWDRYSSANATTLEHELFPLSVTITGDVAVVQYGYRIARENYKKERETVTGHYMDVLLKEGGSWRFIAWAGGDDPEK
jgi:Domain of unknown function (DUF4440)